MSELDNLKDFETGLCFGNDLSFLSVKSVILNVIITRRNL